MAHRAATALATCLAVLAATATAASAFELVQVPASWSVVAAGPQERSLEIEVHFGGCNQKGDFHATVTETPTSIGVSVLTSVSRPTETPPGAPRDACPLNFVSGARQVPLAAPIAGRRFYGLPAQGAPGPLPEPFLSPGALPTQTAVPRVIGLAPSDAKRILGRSWGVRLVTPKHSRRGLPRVIAQTPAPGAYLWPLRTITLQLSR